MHAMLLATIFTHEQHVSTIANWWKPFIINVSPNGTSIALVMSQGLKVLTVSTTAITVTIWN